MKRTFAVVGLLACLGVVLKLASKPMVPSGPPRPIATVGPVASGSGPAGPADAGGSSTLLSKYRRAEPRVRELVERVADRFGRNAEAIERTDGVRGLILLDRLDLEALFLYEKYPKEFHRLRNVLGGDAAADVLLHWREYFGLKRGDETDRGTLVAEISGLSPAQQRVASRYWPRWACCLSWRPSHWSRVPPRGRVWPLDRSCLVRSPPASVTRSPQTQC